MTHMKPHNNPGLGEDLVPNLQNVPDLRKKLHSTVAQYVPLTAEITTAVENLVDMVLGVHKNDDITSIINWLREKQRQYSVEVQEIPIKNLEKWKVDPTTGVISHDTGKFFSIIGVQVKGAQGREVLGWSQPMMKQHECGILGIITQVRQGVRHYLLYAKFEPGNIGKLQLSPTLQATESNLKQAHGGKKPLFAEYFEESGKGRVLTSVVGVEDGGRFYLKTNRSVLVEIPEEEELAAPEDYIWVTLPQLKKLVKEDLVVNSLVRSVLGSL